MLTDTAIRKAKPNDKVQRLFGGCGLYLELAPSGGKWWRLKYRFEGKEKRLSLGTYPDTGLAAARSRRDEARKLLAAGVDPGEQRKAAKVANAERGGNSFTAVADELSARPGALAADGRGRRAGRLDPCRRVRLLRSRAAVARRAGIGDRLSLVLASQSGADDSAPTWRLTDADSLPKRQRDSARKTHAPAADRLQPQPRCPGGDRSASDALCPREQLQRYLECHRCRMAQPDWSKARISDARQASALAGMF
jgi:hypothetical protein